VGVICVGAKQKAARCSDPFNAKLLWLETVPGRGGGLAWMAPELDSSLPRNAFPC